MSFITTPHGLRTSILVFHSFIHSFIDSMLVHNKSCNGMETAQPRHLTLDHIPFPSLYFTPLHFNLLTNSFDKNESLIMQCSRCGAVRCDAVFRALPIFHLEHYTCALFSFYVFSVQLYRHWRIKLMWLPSHDHDPCQTGVNYNYHSKNK